MSQLQFLKNIFIRNTLLIALALLLVSFGVAYIALQDVNHRLVIHFTGERSLNFLGTEGDVFSILFSALMVNVVNGFLVHIFYERIRIFSYLLSSFLMVFNSLLLVVIGVIIAVN